MNVLSQEKFLSQLTNVRQNHDMAGRPCSHRRQYSLDYVNWAKEVRLELVSYQCQSLWRRRQFFHGTNDSYVSIIRLLSNLCALRNIGRITFTTAAKEYIDPPKCFQRFRYGSLAEISTSFVSASILA